jgi:acetyltransferase-like isoleucine patch superfamily enzyme
MTFFKNFNSKSKTQCFGKCKSIKIADNVRINDSEIERNYYIGSFSGITRCKIGFNGGIGFSSYLSDADIGSYTLIGSRVSIGGFQHPTNWLSIGAFQWGQSIDWWVETGDFKKYIKFTKPINKRTLIGSDVWIGDNAVVLSGREISTGAVIGAGSVVTKNIPPYAVAVGNPAKIIRYRFDRAIITSLLKSMWWKLDLKDLQNLNYDNLPEALSKISKIKVSKI